MKHREKKSFIRFIIIFALVFPVLWGCDSSKNGNPDNDFERWHTGFDMIPMSCAKGFTIEKKGEHKLLTVINPWDSSKISARYLLYKGEKPQTPSTVECVKIPVERTGVTSCTQLGFLNILNELETVCGISYPDRVYNEQVRTALVGKKITDIGDPFNLNVEKALAANPSLLWISGYAESENYCGRIRKSGLPVIFVNEWMEADVLARAEWIRFVASFFDKEEQAESYFGQISERYMALTDTLRPLSESPKILSGENFRGSWYMPSADNWLAKLYGDAKGIYTVPRPEGRGSIPFTLEEALSFFSDSDVWMGVDARSLKQLSQSEARYCLFRPFQTGRVYHFSRRSTSTGGNDFWEQAVVEPHILLKDLASIFHPDRFVGYVPKYVERLKQ